MANILYRGSAVPSASNSAGVNNAPLTNDQIDKNFYALNTDKLDKVTVTAQTVASPVTFSSNVTVSGNLTIDGTVTTINSTVLNVDDINIELGAVPTPTDATANGGGITLLGGTNKTITWDSTNANWTSNQDWNIVTGKVFKINNTSVLSATTLGSGVTSSSLTKVGLTTAGFVKSDASGNLSVDTNSYSLTSHGHYIGTTAVQGSSANQSITGITGITGGTSNNDMTVKTADSGNTTASGILYLRTGDATTGNTNSGGISINSGTGAGTATSGNVSIYAGDSGINSAFGGSVSIQGGGSRATTSTGGSVTIWGGSALSTSITSATGGLVGIFGGRTYNVAGGKQGGAVYIDGGTDSSINTVSASAGSVNVGTTGSGYFGAATSAVNIGSSSITTTINGTVKLPNVGTSGFVKIGAGGQLSNDTNTYLTSVSTANITDGAVTTAKIADGAATIAKGGTGITTYTAGDILYASGANTLSKLAKGSDGQVLKLASGVPTWGTDNDTDTITRIRTGGNTFSAGDFTFSGSGSVSVTQTGGSISISGTDTTYSAGTGLTLTGTSFSVNYGTSATTACVGNDSRLSDSRPASDVYAWAKAATKPSYAYSEITSTPAALPASDVYAWAKAATKPSYSASEISGAFYSGIGLELNNDGGNYLRMRGSSAASISFYDVKDPDNGIYNYTMTMDNGYYTWFFSTANSAYDQGTAKMTLDLYGNLITSNNITAYGSPSDRNLKENIQPLTNSLEKVKALQGVSFDWKQNTPEHKMVGMTHDIGLIAQNVQEVLPELVREGEDGFLSLRDRGLVAVLIEAIKELNAKVEDLQNQLANK